MSGLEIDNIILMAREAGFDLTMFEFSLGFVTHGTHEEFERFAALVAAAEREACAKLCLETEPFYGVMFAEAIRARGQK
jgi:hypothetical protein